MPLPLFDMYHLLNFRMIASFYMNLKEVNPFN